MKAKWYNWSITACIVLAIGISGCAKPSGALVEEVPAVPVPRKIAVLTVNSPEKLHTQNKGLLSGIAYPAWLEMLDNRWKTKDFNAKLDSVRSGMGVKMTTDLVAAFEQEGFEVALLTGPKGPSNDPENVDYKKLATDSAILHLWFHDVGMYSGRTSSHYVPRINVTAYLLYAHIEEYLYNETLYYGADARGEDYWSIPAPPNHRFPDFPAMVENQSDVVESYHTGIRAVAIHLSKELRKRFLTNEKTTSLN